MRSISHIRYYGGLQPCSMAEGVGFRDAHIGTPLQASLKKFIRRMVRRKTYDIYPWDTARVSSTGDFCRCMSPIPPCIFPSGK